MQYYLSVEIKDELVSFLAFFTARFSFNESAGFLTASFLLFRSLDMVLLQMGVACRYLHNCLITLLQTYKKVLINNRAEEVKIEQCAHPPASICYRPSKILFGAERILVRR